MIQRLWKRLKQIVCRHEYKWVNVKYMHIFDHNKSVKLPIKLCKCGKEQV